jgi:hypothetical protein
MLASYGILRAHPKDACVALIAACRSLRDQFQNKGIRDNLMSPTPRPN